VSLIMQLQYLQLANYTPYPTPKRTSVRPVKTNFVVLHCLLLVANIKPIYNLNLICRESITTHSSLSITKSRRRQKPG